MAFIKNSVVGHAIQWGKGTLAEADALLAAMSILQRSQIVGSSFEVASDSTATNNGVWMITATSRYKVSNDAETGTMDAFTVKVGSSTDSITNGEVVEFKGAGVISAALSTGTSGEAVVTTKVAATSADATKVVKIDTNGVSTLAYETVFDKENTATVLLNITDGVISGQVKPNTNKGIQIDNNGVEAKLSTDARQELVFGTDGGLYVKELAIASDSQSRLSYDSATNTLGLTALGMNRVTVDTVSTTLAAVWTANGGNMQEGDVVISTQMGTAYIHNGGNANASSDLTLIEKPSVTDAAIRALLSAEKGVQYNATTGKFSARLRAVDSTHLNELKLDGDDLYVDVVNTNIYINKTQTLVQWLTDINNTSNLAYLRVYENALTETTDVNGLQTVRLGGSLVQATEIQVGNYNYNLASSGTGAINITTDQFAINHGFFAVNDLGEQVFMRLSAFNTWYVDTTAVYPN